MKSFAPVDLTDEAQAVGWVEAAAAEFGGVDVLYNNASVARVGPGMSSITPSGAAR